MSIIARRRTAAASQAIVTDGLTLRLDAGNPASYPGSGATWTDLSGNGNNATLQGSGYSYTTENGGAIVLNGSNAWALINSSTSLNSANISLFAWFYKTGTVGNESAFLRKENQWSLQLVDNSTLAYLVGTSGNTGWTSRNFVSYTLTNNIWYSMALTYDGSQLRMFMNNTLLRSDGTTGNIVTNTSSVFVGYWITMFPGRIAALLAYNRALTDAEVAQNYGAFTQRLGM